MDPQDPPGTARPAGGDARAATLFDLLPVGAYRTSPQGELLRANAALVRMAGFASEAEMLACFRDVSTGWYADPRRHDEFTAAIDRDGQVVGFVSEVTNRLGGGPVWVSENAHAVRDAQGRLLYYEGTIEDVTKRVKAEVALQRSEAHLRMITQNLPVSVYRLKVGTDGRRRYTFVSEGARTVFGVEPEAVMADPFLLETLRHPDDAPRVAEAIARASSADEVLTLEFRIRTPAGVDKWVQVMSRPMAAADGERVRIGVAIDITAQKQAMEWRLERDRAEAADRAKTALLSRVSHELRTPLNAVLGFGQLLEADAALAPPHRAWVGHILDSGRHLLSLVDDVLDLSSAHAGRISLSCTAVDLREALVESWTMLSVAGLDGGLSYDDRGVPAAPLWVQADARRLRQVLSNLLSNAVKYNRPGGRVTVRALRQAAVEGDAVQGEVLALQVADTGAGMTAEQMARLFNPFERLGAQHGSVRGTGLGLALSKQLVEAMGGSLTAESAPGRGTVFTVRLRAAAALG